MLRAVKITLITAGEDTGPYFDIYTDVDCYTIPIVENVPKSSLVDLVNGYALIEVPDLATRIRVQSKGNCDNFVDITITTE